MLSFIYASRRSKKNNESIPSIAHLRKEIFLLCRSTTLIDMKDIYYFEPLCYGPFLEELWRPDRLPIKRLIDLITNRMVTLYTFDLLMEEIGGDS